MSRPMFAFAVKRNTYIFEGDRCTGTETKTISRQPCASYAGALFLERKFGESDETVFGVIDRLAPGTVYDHIANKWVQGLEWKPYGEPQVRPFDAFR